MRFYSKDSLQPKTFNLAEHSATPAGLVALQVNKPPSSTCTSFIINQNFPSD